MATATRPGPFARKSHDALLRDATRRPRARLKRAVGVLDLTALGIGAVIGTGIFVIIGEAIGDAGPSIIVSFALAGVTCLFSAFSYAELASSIPVSGSAYTYGYATLGELVAWIIGWDLILEYGVAVAAVAVGWGGYLKSLLDSLFGDHLPDVDRRAARRGGDGQPPGRVPRARGGGAAHLRRARERAHQHRHGRHQGRDPRLLRRRRRRLDQRRQLLAVGANGFNGTVDAAALIFFAYIGFDAISTSGEEAENPSRDLPIAIIGALLICTLLYIVVAVVTVGLAPADELAGTDAPLADALKLGAGVGDWAADILSVGALIAITSVTLTVLYGQTRIMFAMSRDGLVPRWVGKLARARRRRSSPRPSASSWPIIAAFVPLSEIAKLVNIGTLFAFLHRQHRRHRAAPHGARHGALRSACRWCRCSRSSAARCAST